MKIALVGAMDRYNYGDLLFPLIVKKELSKRTKKEVEFHCFGSIEADMRPYGGELCKSLTTIDTSFDAIIFVGGETLTASWVDTYVHLQNNRAKVFISRVLKKVFGRKYSEILFKKILGYSFMNYPWIFHAGIFGIDKILYNTVSGTQQSFYDGITGKYILDLNTASYISVRDSLTEDNLLKIGLSNVKKYPDSAYVMSDTYSQKELTSKISTELEKNISEQDYIVFQIGKMFAEGNIHVIASELIKIIEHTGMKLVLLPIGKAAGHEDYVPLSEIYELLRKEGYKSKVELLDVAIFETMFIISNAKLFIGTSLHGNITSLTYNIPTVALDRRIQKLTEFLKDYSITEQQYSVEYRDIFSAAQKSLAIDMDKLKLQSHLVKEKIHENFDNLSKILEL